MSRGTVLVTGAGGYLGSWLVRLLLHKGYTVRATVRDPDDKKNTQPMLEDLSEDLAQNLKIFRANLLVDGDFDAAVEGCEGVFHLAAPVKPIVEGCEGVFHLAAPVKPIVEDYQKEMVDPMVKGTLNVLESCIKSGTVNRFVHVSSVAAMLVSELEVADESHWTDAESFIKKQNTRGWEYSVGKVIAEKAAVEFAKEHNLDMVIINPSYVLGPFTGSRLVGTVGLWFATLISGDERMALGISSFVHIEDFAQASIFLYENPEAHGRYICNSEDVSLTEMGEIVRSRHRDIELNFKPKEENGQIDSSVFVGPRVFDSTKLKKLGFEYQYSVEQIIDDSIACCKKKGLLQQFLKLN